MGGCGVHISRFCEARPQRVGFAPASLSRSAAGVVSPSTSMSGRSESAGTSAASSNSLRFLSSWAVLPVVGAATASGAGSCPGPVDYEAETAGPTAACSAELELVFVASCRACTGVSRSPLRIITCQNHVDDGQVRLHRRRPRERETGILRGRYGSGIVVGSGQARICRYRL